MCPPPSPPPRAGARGPCTLPSALVIAAPALCAGRQPAGGERLRGRPGPFEVLRPARCGRGRRGVAPVCGHRRGRGVSRSRVWWFRSRGGGRAQSPARIPACRPFVQPAPSAPCRPGAAGPWGSGCLLQTLQEHPHFPGALALSRGALPPLCLPHRGAPSGPCWGLVLVAHESLSRARGRDREGGWRVTLWLRGLWRKGPRPTRCVSSGGFGARLRAPTLLPPLGGGLRPALCPWRAASDARQLPLLRVRRALGAAFTAFTAWKRAAGRHRLQAARDVTVPRLCPNPPSPPTSACAPAPHGTLCSSGLGVCLFLGWTFKFVDSFRRI